jgi:hypothetical protein
MGMPAVTKTKRDSSKAVETGNGRNGMENSSETTRIGQYLVAWA